MLNPDPIELIKPRGAAAILASAPIVMVAIDLNAASQELAEALRETARRIIRNTPNARIACVNVMKIARIALDDDLDAEGNSKHVLRLAALKQWSAPLGAEEGDITYHVLEAVSPAQAILTFARDNNVDHVVMGARPNSTLRSLNRQRLGRSCSVGSLFGNRGPGAGRHLAQARLVGERRGGCGACGTRVMPRCASEIRASGTRWSRC